MVGEAQAGSKVAEYPRFPVGAHPLDQASLWLPHPLYDWQIDACRAFAEPFSRVVYSTNNESGKTSTLGPLFVLSIMAAFPGARVFATSASEQQVLTQLLETNILPIINKWPDTWEYLKSERKVRHKNGSMFLAYKCDDPNKVEGFHSTWEKLPDGRRRWLPCAYLIDEAKGVHEEVYKRIHRINPYFMLAMSSPGDMNTWHYRAVDPDTLAPT